MQVNCKCHNEKKDRDTLFKIVTNGKNEYYCSELEYTRIKEEKQSRLNTINLINDIFEYVITNTILFKELSDIAIVHTYKKMESYIQENKLQLSQFMTKNFNNEYGKIKYFTTILKNNLKDYHFSVKKDEVKFIQADIITVKFAQKARKKCLDEFVEEME